jgi:hypothetical protein
MVMKFESLMRAEGVVNKIHLLELQEAIESIAQDMIEDGFEYSDVKKFIKVQLDEILGD